MDTIKNINITQENTQSAEIKIGTKVVDSKRKDLQTSKLSLINPYYVYFPTFYKKEVKTSAIVFILWLVSFTLFSVCTAAILVILLGYHKDDRHNSVLIILMFIPAFIIMLTFLITYACRYHSFNEEAKIINFKDEKVLSVNIQKLYKRLKIGYININWMCGLSYLACGFAILILMVVSQIVHGFGSDSVSRCFTPGWTDEFFAFFIIMFVLALSVVLHFTLIVTNYLRCSRIENYYNTFIVLPEEIIVLKKQANKRNFIIFCIVLFFFGFVYWIVRKILGKKKAQATVVVK